jgi:hypothetical protein
LPASTPTATFFLVDFLVDVLLTGRRVGCQLATIVR